jgi:hypothetical protein
MSVQNGYGFVHYPLTAEGINSALTAVKSLHQVTINQITFDCSVSNQLNQVLANMEKNSGGVGGSGFSPSNSNNRNRRAMNLNQMSGFQPDSRGGNNRSFTLNNGMSVNTTIPTANNGYPSPGGGGGGGRGPQSASGYSLPLPPMMSSSPRTLQPGAKQYYPPTHVHAAYDQPKTNHIPSGGGMSSYPNYISSRCSNVSSASYSNPRGPTVFSFSSSDFPSSADDGSFASDRDTQSHLSSYHASKSDNSSYSGTSMSQQKHLQPQSSYHSYYSDFPADRADSPNNLHLPFPSASTQQQLQQQDQQQPHQHQHYYQQQQQRYSSTDDMLNSLITSTENLNVEDQQYELKQQFSQLGMASSHPTLSALAGESAEFNNDQQEEKKASSPPSSHHSSNASRKSSRSNSRESANFPPGLVNSSSYFGENRNVNGYSYDNNHDFVTSNPPPYSSWA